MTSFFSENQTKGLSPQVVFPLYCASRLNINVLSSGQATNKKKSCLARFNGHKLMFHKTKSSVFKAVEGHFGLVCFFFFAESVRFSHQSKLPLKRADVIVYI